MAAPVVNWMSQDNATDIAANGGWNIGIIDAGTPSTDFGVLIWNNRGGSTALSDMNDCVITTKDTSGGNTTDVVIGKWVEVKVVSMSETSYTAVGGNTTKAIKAAGAGVAAGTIKGAANDGVKENSTENFSEVILRANPPLNSSAGTYNFLTRISYTFV